jgi:hypothetical protein
LSEEEQIQKLEDVAQTSLDVNVRKKTIDALALYGDKSISAISNVVRNALNNEVREHGLDAIKRIKEQRK